MWKLSEVDSSIEVALRSCFSTHDSSSEEGPSDRFRALQTERKKQNVISLVCGEYKIRKKQTLQKSMFKV